MDIPSKKPTKKSAKRMRLGVRSSLALLLLILLILLISWIFGFRPPQDSSSSTNRTPEPMPVSKASFNGSKKQGPQQTARIREVEAAPISPKHPASIHLDSALKESHAESGIWEFAVGPTWISGALPANLSGEEFATFDLISALGLADKRPSKAQELKLNGGRFSFRAPCQLSFVYLRVETQGRIDLFGPYILPPWKLRDLGQLQENDTAPWQTVRETKVLGPDDHIIAIPKTTPSLFETPITGLVSPSRKSGAPTTSVTVKAADDRPVGKKLGGPWEFFLQRDDGTFRPWRNRLEEERPLTQFRLKNLTRQDQIVFVPSESGHGVLLKRDLGSEIVTLPQSLAPKDHIAYVRYGSRLASILVSDVPGATTTLPEPTSVVFPRDLLSIFTFVAHSAPTSARERIIRRNQVLFGLDDLTVVAIELGATSVSAEHVAAQQETSNRSGKTRKVPCVRLKMNPGRYDLVQIQGTLSGGIETIRTIEIPETRDDFVITKLGSVNRRQIVGYVKDETTKKPIEGVGLQLNLDSSCDEDSTWIALSDKAGKIVLSGLPAGKISFKAHSPHHQVRKFNALLPSSGSATKTLTIFMTPSPSLSITVSSGANERPVIDGMVLVREDGLTMSAPASGGRISFGALKESSYVAVPYMGSASIPTDDWGWLCNESGGLFINHQRDTGPKSYHWTSPAPISVKFNIQVSQAPHGTMELAVVHCGVAPYPGIWPNHHYDGVPFGLVELDRLLPGNYRAIATIAGQSEIMDFTVPIHGTSVIPLHFEFPKE